MITLVLKSSTTKTKSLNQVHRRWLKRQQPIEPAIAHLKTDNRISRCWLKGAVGDAINAVTSVAGCNLRWLLRAVAAGTIKRFYFVQILRRLISDTRHDLDAAGQKARSIVRRGGWCLERQAGFMRLAAARWILRGRLNSHSMTNACPWSGSESSQRPM